jgi:predicted acetyltransferase
MPVSLRICKKGFGEAVARRVFDLFPGNWQVAQIPENLNATAFWRKVIGRYTAGRYREVQAETEHWHGPVQIFNNQEAM